MARGILAPRVLPATPKHPCFDRDEAGTERVQADGALLAEGDVIASMRWPAFQRGEGIYGQRSASVQGTGRLRRELKRVFSVDTR